MLHTRLCIWTVSENGSPGLYPLPPKPHSEVTLCGWQNVTIHPPPPRWPYVVHKMSHTMSPPTPTQGDLIWLTKCYNPPPPPTPQWPYIVDRMLHSTTHPPQVTLYGWQDVKNQRTPTPPPRWLYMIDRILKSKTPPPPRWPYLVDRMLNLTPPPPPQWPYVVDKMLQSVTFFPPSPTPGDPVWLIGFKNTHRI